jgi:hypothetical protein
MKSFRRKKILWKITSLKNSRKDWKFIPPDDLEVDGYEEPLLISNSIRALKRINEEIGIGYA